MTTRSCHPKGFRPTEGVFEHQFVLDEVVIAAKMQSKSFAVTWLDIRNAFGSVETVSMLQILTFFKAPKYISGVIRNIYEGGEFLLQGGDGVHASIPVTKGVRQGCPLSGVLFNLVMEPLLRDLMKTRIDGFRSAYTVYTFSLIKFCCWFNLNIK